MISQTLKNLLIIQSAYGAGSFTAVKTYYALKENAMLDKDIKEILSSSILPLKTCDKLRKVSENKVAKIIKDCFDNKIKILTIEDERFPERLRNISEPPLVLYIKGELPNIDDLPVICIVGPREVSEFGQKSAYALGMRLSKAGFIVVSGAAKGSDSFAHKGALNNGGRTIAVLGCGICYNYLPQNRELRNKIAENCCLISEHPPFSPTTKYSFPIRNRLMSALSDGTIVVEGPEGSGALITARHANEQGKDVFVIPGNPTLKEYKGSNELLRDGASPLIDVSDIFTRYITLYPEQINIAKAYQKSNNPKKEKILVKKSDITLSKEAKIVYNNLNKQKFTADDLVNINISDDELISALTELEFEHLIKSLPGGMYELITS